MKNRQYPSIALLAILILSMSFFCMASCTFQPPPHRPPFEWDISPEQLESLRFLLPYYLIVKTVLATLNTILLLLLFIVYFRIYRRTNAKFSMGLVIFSLALLIYTLASNPLIYFFMGFNRVGFGPMFMIPDIFTCIASAILLYLSRQ